MSGNVAPLKRMAEVRVSNVDKKSVEGDTPVRLCNYTDVYYNHRITGRLDFMTATATPEQVKAFSLRPGDVVFTKDSESADDIAVPALVAEPIPGVVCGYHLALARPRQHVDGRFLYWTIASQVGREQFSLGATGVTRFGLRQDEVGRVVLPCPPIEHQRAIADFLDVETGRIDALIAAKRRMIELLELRHAESVDSTLRNLASRAQRSPLKYAVKRVEVGIVVTPAAWYSDEGVSALRGLNVKPGRIVKDDLVKISNEGHEFNRKSRLSAGDVVIVRTGQAGAAAVVPPDLDGSNCIDLVIVRPACRLLPQYLEYVLNATWTQEHVREHSVGSIQSHFNVGAMKEMPIPLPPVEEQATIVEAFDNSRAQAERLKSALTRQIQLLAEHRQALITAAVTGELEIPLADHADQATGVQEYA